MMCPFLFLKLVSQYKGGAGLEGRLYLIGEESCPYLNRATKDILSCYVWTCTKDPGRIYKPNTKNHV